MDQGGATFDLTQPPGLQQRSNIQKQENKTLSVTIQPKKEEPKKVVSVAPQTLISQNQTKFPSIPQTQAKSQKSSNSMPKPNKIELLRNILDIASTQQQSLSQNKKEKKIKQQGSTKVLKDVYQQKVVEQYNTVYKDTEAQGHILYELKHLEKKRNIQQQIKTKEEILTEEKSHHDEVVYEIKQQELLLKQLDNLILFPIQQQLIDLGLVQVKEQEVSVLEVKKAELAGIEVCLAQMNHETGILGYMYEQRSQIYHKLMGFYHYRKATSPCLKIVVQSQKCGINTNSTSYRQKTIDSLSKIVEKYRNEQITNGNQLWASQWKADFDPFLQNILSDQISYFEDKKAFNEVINHQKLIEEQKKRDQEEMQRLEMQKTKSEKEKTNEKIRQDKKKIENLLNEKVVGSLELGILIYIEKNV